MEILYYRNAILDGNYSDPTTLEILSELARAEWTEKIFLPQFTKPKSLRPLEFQFMINPSTPIEVLHIIFKKIVNPSSDSIWDVILENPKLPPSILEKILDHYAGQHDRLLRKQLKAPMRPPLPLRALPSLKERALLHPNIPNKILEKYAQNPNKRIRAAVASNPNISTPLLISLANDPHYMVRESVAMHPSTPLDVLKNFMNDTEVEVRASLAANPNLPEIYLQKLSTDDDPIVRTDLAHNPSIPLKLLQILSKDTYPKVRQSVATNGNTSQDLLETLSQDDIALVREAVAINANTPSKIISRLAIDLVDRVRLAALGNKNLPQKFKKRVIEFQDSKLALDLLQSGNGEPFVGDLLKIIENDRRLLSRSYGHPVKPLTNSASMTSGGPNSENFDDKQKLAMNPLTSSEELTILMKDPSPKVRGAILLNPNIDNETLEKMANDHSSEIRRLVVSHYRASESIFEKLNEDNDIQVKQIIANRTANPTLLLKLSSTPQHQVLFEILKNSNTNAQTLDSLSLLTDNQIRKGVMKHPNSSFNTILRIIYEDHNMLQYFISERGRYLSKDWIQALISHFTESRKQLARIENLSPEIYFSFYWPTTDGVRETSIIYELLQNPSTPAEILQDIYKRDDLPLLISANPNTPTEILAELGKLYQLREGPSIHHQIEYGVQYNLAKNPNTPKDILLSLLLLRVPEITHELLMNPSFNIDLKSEIIRNPSNYSDELVAIIKDVIPHDEDVSEETLYLLARDENPKVRELAISSLRSSPIDWLLEWIDDPNSMIRLHIIDNRSRVPYEIATKLARDPDSIVRGFIASSWYISPEDLELLFDDYNTGIRRNLSNNPILPYNLLRRLAQDNDPTIFQNIIHRIHRLEDLIRFRLTAPQELQSQVMDKIFVQKHLQDTYGDLI